MLKKIGIGLLAFMLVSSLAFFSCGGGGGGGGNPLPDLGVVEITPTSGFTGQLLTASYTPVASETVSYQWKRGDTNIGSNTVTYTASIAGSYTVTVSAAGYNSRTSNTVVIATFSLPDTVADAAALQTLLTEMYTNESAKFTAVLAAVNAMVANSEIPVLIAGDYATGVGDWTSAMWDELYSVYGTIATKLNTAILELTGTISISGSTTAPAELSALYTGGEPVSYQWYKDGTVIAGANAITYSATEAGSYTVTVSATGYESKTSAAHVVTAAPSQLQALFGNNKLYAFGWESDTAVYAGYVLLYDGSNWVGPAARPFAGQQICVLAFPNAFDMASISAIAPSGNWNTNIVDISGGNKEATTATIVTLLGNTGIGTSNFFPNWLASGKGILLNDGDWLSYGVEKVTITYDAQGGAVTPASKEINKDTAIGTLPTPTRAGYRFLAWYTAATEGTEVTTATIFSANATIYARWIQQFTVTFYDGATAYTDPAPQQIDTGGLVTQPADPVKGGHTFGGWYKEDTLTTPWVFATDTVTANTSIYAKFDALPPDQKTVEFNADGGTPAPTPQVIAVGGLVTEPAAMTKANHTFGGWYKEAAFTNLWIFASDTVTDNITLYAKWTSTETPGDTTVADATPGNTGKVFTLASYLASNPTTPLASPFALSGSPTIVISNGGINVSDRTADWNAIDFNVSSFNPATRSIKITVAGNIIGTPGAGSEMKLGGATSYGEFAKTALTGDNATFNLEYTIPSTFTENIRIQTNSTGATLSFRITKIIVEDLGERGFANTWGPVVFAGLEDGGEYVTGNWGIQVADKGTTTMAVVSGSLHVTATSGGWKAINIQTGTAVGGTDYYASNGFPAVADKEYTVSFNASVASGTGQVRVRGNGSAGSWGETNLTETATPVTYTYTQSATGGNLQIDTGNTPEGVALIISNLKIEWN